MANKILELTSSAGAVILNEEGVLLVEASGSGSRIEYKSEAEAVKKEYIVNEAPAAVAGAGSKLFAATDRASGLTIYLNVDNVVSLSDDSDSKSVVRYDNRGAGMKSYEIDEDSTTIAGVMNAL